MRNLKKWIAALLAVVMIFSLGLDGWAYAAVGSGEVMYGADQLPDSDYDGIPDQYDAAPNSNVFTGKLKSGHDGTTTVSFTVDFRNFFGDNTMYHPELATVSVMGAALAYYDPNYANACFTYDTAQTWAGGTASKVDGMELMQVLGFEDVVDYTLDSYGDDDLCEVVMGHRTVTYNGQTEVIVAIWVRGTESTSAEEWSSNFHMGDLVRFFDEYDSVAGKTPRQKNDDWTRKTNHRGFDVCATRLMNYLKTYYLDQYVQPELDTLPEAELTYWLTGHSRGAAVANLMGSYLIDQGERVFDYTFAAPYNTANTEASAEKYDCIFNLVNANDFIPMLPMPEWGFTRYGRTATVDASQYASQIKTATGEDYSGKYLTASDMSTLLGKFICITGENADRNNPGKILGWREVYVYHCGHEHPGETVGNYQSTTVKSSSFLSGVTESNWNGYATRLKKYSYWNGGICQTPAYDLQVLVELLVKVAQGETIGGASTYITSNKLADKFDFGKWSLVSYATKLTEPHFMDTYSVIQAQINAAGDPGDRFHTLQYYTSTNADGGRPAHTHTYTYVPYEGQEPTCAEDGLGYRYCLCSETNADYYDDYQKNVVIPATGHDWNEPTYEWAADYSTVTATRTCKTDVSHVETETVNTAAVTTGGDCETGGQTVYTATFNNPAFETQTLTVENGAAAGHDWGEPTWNWAADYSAATASFVCRNNAEHTAQVDATVTKTATEPTCNEGGTTVYTAAAELDGVTYTDTKTVTTDALGHTPGETVIENEVAPTCTEPGSYDEVVRCTVCGEEISRRTVTVPATGHDYGTPVYNWAEDNSAVTAVVICKNDPDHTVTETVETTYEVVTEPTTEAEGLGRYTAAFENELFEIQTKDVVIDKLPIQGYHIIVTDKTNGAASASIDAVALYSGDVTFTVTCAKACVVAIVNGDGTYTKLACTTGNGEHKYTVTVTDADVEIVVAMKGDVNLDGKISTMDATMAKQRYLGTAFAINPALQMLTADVNGDNKITTMDATMIKQAYLGSTTLPW